MSLQRTLKRKLNDVIKNKNYALLDELKVLLDKAIDKPHNLILLGDAYKYSHHKFYEKNTTTIYSYLESRGGRFNETIFFGLQYFLKYYLEGVAITQEDLEEAYDYLGTTHGVFGREDVFDKSKFQYIIDVHGGRLPIEIKAVPEGMSVPNKNVLLTVENTDPNCYWLTNFLESLILQVWYPITVATLSREVKKIVLKELEETTTYSYETNLSICEFILNDFGFRGASSVQSAMIGGSAHLINFNGSDNTMASKCIRDFYNTDIIYGKSIPATEHSIMTIKGEEGEVEMMKRVLEQYPTGIVACVSDSYNIFRACKKYWGGELKDLILSRPSTLGNQLVIRPDSGHVINSLREIFNILFEEFGYTTNSKGYKVLPPQLRVIQGDGVNINSIIQIYKMLREENISPENLVLGMGGKLLQSDLDRDTQKFATKVSFAIVDGELRDVVKRPIEMDSDGNIIQSFKVSKKGRLKLYKPSYSNLETITSMDENYDMVDNLLEPVFKDGIILKEFTFEEVKVNATIKPHELLNVKSEYI